jgi:hypothetical protein
MSGGQRGREFKSCQPDIKVPSETGFRSRLRRSNRLNVATGVATGILTTSPPESLPKPLGGLALLVHCHVAVDVCGDFVGVPEHLPDDLDVSPRGDERGGRAVSESVQAHPGQPRPLGDGCEGGR